MLAVVGDLTVATMFALVIMIPLSVARRRRDRERMDRLRRADRLLDARAAAAGTTVEVLLGLADPPPPPTAPEGVEAAPEASDETASATLGRMPGAASGATGGAASGAASGTSERAAGGPAAGGAGVNMANRG